MSDSSSRSHHHVVVLPLPAQGHLSPMICIAHYLASQGPHISVTLVQTRRTHALLRSDICKGLRVEVMGDALPLDTSEPITREHLLKSYAVMQEEFEGLLGRLVEEEGGSPPALLVSDSFLPWTHLSAARFSIPRIELWAPSASTFSMALSAPLLPRLGHAFPVLPECEDEVVDCVPGLEAVRLGDFPMTLITSEATGKGFEFFTAAVAHSREADRVLINTFYELESSVIDAVNSAAAGWRISVASVGPLIASLMGEVSRQPATTSLLEADGGCMQWLDKQFEESEEEGDTAGNNTKPTKNHHCVLYAAFGSLAAVPDHVITELALGLEASQQRFLWVIRPDIAKKRSLDELLPAGFLDHTRGRGLIVSWAPQPAVLRHPAVGAFLTHCGWNSTLEALAAGVPMIGLPLAYEQNTNFKFIVEEWRVGIPLLPHPHASCDRLSVERAVRSMLAGPQGSDARAAASALQQLAARAFRASAENSPHSNANSSRASLERLVDDLTHGRLKAPTVSTAPVPAPAL